MWYFRNSITRQISNFFEFFFYYLKKKVIIFSVGFEKSKNRIVKFFLMKRGRYNRPFLHLTTMAVLGAGVVIAPFLADTYPIFAQQTTVLDLAATPAEKQSVLLGQQEVFATQTTQIRGEIITYTVQKGDTISTVARKFGISEETLRWENDLGEDDMLSVGDQLDILPLTGIAHKVQPGDTVYTLAEKYNSSAQKIVDWQFNDFASPETFALVTGQILIIPDGIKPSEKPFIRPQTYIARGPVPVAGGGFTYPVRGPISQGFAFYHPGIDITAPLNTPIVAAHSGTVVRVSVGTWDGGFGTNISISNGNGIETLYAHLNSVNVSVGQRVVGGGSIIGFNGSTGRSTGPHVHFEIRQNGAIVNPFAYIQ